MLLAGSDTYSDSGIVREDSSTTARVLVLLALELLRLWEVDTPTAVLPGRRIGRLRPGFESSALVLSCNPLVDRGCLSRITTRLKQGRWLTIPPASQ